MELTPHEAMDYDHWYLNHVFLLVPAQQYVGKYLPTFKEVPPSQEGGTFSLDHVLTMLQEARTSGK